MMNTTLFQLGDNEHVFVFVPHHLIWDGWSFDLMQRELGALYDAAERGRPHNLPALATTHGDYAEWLEKWLTEPACEEQLAFWRGRLEGAKAVRPPKTDMPRRAGKSGQGGAHWIHVDLQSTQHLREIARDMDVTLSMLTFGIYALTMAQVTGQRHHRHRQPGARTPAGRDGRRHGLLQQRAAGLARGRPDRCRCLPSCAT